jgi:hypothetical protein
MPLFQCAELSTLGDGDARFATSMIIQFGLVRVSAAVL